MKPHQTVLQAYQEARGYSDPEMIVGLAKELRPLERQGLLPESRLLLALLPKMAHELRIAQRFCAAVLEIGRLDAAYYRVEAVEKEEFHQSSKPSLLASVKSFSALEWSPILEWPTPR